MATLQFGRRELLGTVVAACASIAGCTSRDDEPEEDELEHFGYGGQPVVHDETGQGTPGAGEESEPTDDEAEDGSETRDADDDGPTIGFGAGADPELEYGVQGYGEEGYGGVLA